MARQRLKPDRLRYLKSLSSELVVQSDRVRHLIGDRHWYSDGHHKEELLKTILRRHTPSVVRVAQGFVASPIDPGKISREQDILVIDERIEAPVFTQGDLVIVFPRSVLAAISVKATLAEKLISESIENQRSVRDIANEMLGNEPKIWYGCFFYELDRRSSSDPSSVYGFIESNIDASDASKMWIPNVIASSKRLLFRNMSAKQSDKNNLLGFECGDIATAVFLANLIDHLTDVLGGQRSDFADFVDFCDFECIPRSLD